jgi:hypothetical protein
MLEDLANIWIGCGCLFMLGAVLFVLVIGLGQGGTTSLLALLGLLGIGAYLIWARRG